MSRAVLTTLLWRAMVVLTGGGALVVAILPDPRRPVLTAAGLAAAACLVAAVGRWRLAGTSAVGLVTTTALLAGALDASPLRALQLLGVAALLLGLVSALGRNERSAGTVAVHVLRAPVARRLRLPALGLAGAALVSVTAAQQVVPSVQLALVGLVAGVAALVLATRAHRNRSGTPLVPK